MGKKKNEDILDLNKSEETIKSDDFKVETNKDSNSDNAIESVTDKKEVNALDNPMSKKVKTELDKVEHNKNNQVLTDSDLIGNVIL